MYSVHSIFKTIQGEGVHMGRPAVFVRFAGCNVWSGDPATRERDTAKGCCAAWCDTEFRANHLGENGGKYGTIGLAQKIFDVAANTAETRTSLVVFTGGEPSLQVTCSLVAALKDYSTGFHLAMETNGSKDVSKLGLDWVTLSPKPPMSVVQQHYDEVKCVYPAGFDPEDYARYANVRWVQPRDPMPEAGSPPTLTVGEQFLLKDVLQAEESLKYQSRRTLLAHSWRENMRRCVDYVLDHPRWKLGVQGHKVWGVA